MEFPVTVRQIDDESKDGVNDKLLFILYFQI